MLKAHRAGASKPLLSLLLVMVLWGGAPGSAGPSARGPATGPAPGGAAAHQDLAAVPAFPSEEPLAFGAPSSRVIAAGDLSMKEHRTGQASWEPTIGVTEGEIYATAWQSFIDPGVLMSTDGGETWENISPDPIRGKHAVSTDPYLFTDRNRVFNLDAYALTCGQMSYSDDQGRVWVTNPVACGTVVSDHPSAFAGSPVTSTTLGYPNVVYVCDYRPFGLLTSIYCSKSINGGITFVPTGDPAFPVARNRPCDGGLSGHGIAGEDGTIYIPRVTKCGPQLSISKDEGATWRVVDLPKEPGTSGDHEASVGVDRSGNVFYMWIDENRLPYLSVSADGAKSFSQPLKVSPRKVKETNLPALAVNRSGQVVMVYAGSTNSPAITSKRSQPCSNTTTQPSECAAPQEYKDVTWNGYVTVARNPVSSKPRFETKPINPADDPIDREACGPDRCFPLGDFIDITAAGDGRFWAAFVDGCIGRECVDFYGGELVVVEIDA